MAPPNSRSFSVKVVLPASGCEMMAKVRRRSISPESGERLWPKAGSEPVARAGMFMARYLQSHGRDSRQVPNLESECGIETEFAAGLLDGKLAVVLGDVVDAGRAVRHREQRRLRRSARAQRPRAAGFVEP